MDFRGWHKSTRSQGNSGCIEVATNGQLVGVRDTKNRQGGMLIFDREAWIAFIDAVKADKLG